MISDCSLTHCRHLKISDCDSFSGISVADAPALGPFILYPAACHSVGYEHRHWIFLLSRDKVTEERR